MRCGGLSTWLRLAIEGEGLYDCHSSCPPPAIVEDEGIDSRDKGEPVFVTDDYENGCALSKSDLDRLQAPPADLAAVILLKPLYPLYSFVIDCKNAL